MSFLSNAFQCIWNELHTFLSLARSSVLWILTVSLITSLLVSFMLFYSFTTLGILLFLQHNRHASVSGPLHLLILGPDMLFSQIFRHYASDIMQFSLFLKQCFSYLAFFIFYWQVLFELLHFPFLLVFIFGCFQFVRLCGIFQLFTLSSACITKVFL